MRPILSVIVPAYNASSYIRACLDSILMPATGDSLEVLVIDDGSRDETLSICRGIEDGRLSVHHQKNGGVSSARNSGLQFSQGEFVMFVDADDVLADGWWEEVRQHLSPEEDIVFFSARASHGVYSTREMVESIIGINPAEGLRWITSPFSKIYRRTFLSMRNISFDLGVINGEDALFNLKSVLLADNIRFMQGSIYRYRIHSSSATYSYDYRFVNSNERYLVLLSSLLSDNGFAPEEIREYVRYSFCSSIEILALRIARVGDRRARKCAIRDLESNGVLLNRLRSTAASSRIDTANRLIYLLFKVGWYSAAIAGIRALRAFKEKHTETEWVRI